MVSKKICPSSKIALSFHCNHLDVEFPGAKSLRYIDEKGRQRSVRVREGVFVKPHPQGWKEDVLYEAVGKFSSQGDTTLNAPAQPQQTQPGKE